MRVCVYAASCYYNVLLMLSIPNLYGTLFFCLLNKKKKTLISIKCFQKHVFVTNATCFRIAFDCLCLIPCTAHHNYTVQWQKRSLAVVFFFLRDIFKYLKNSFPPSYFRESCIFRLVCNFEITKNKKKINFTRCKRINIRFNVIIVTFKLRRQSNYLWLRRIRIWSLIARLKK